MIANPDTFERTIVISEARKEQFAADIEGTVEDIDALIANGDLNLAGLIISDGK